MKCPFRTTGITFVIVLLLGAFLYFPHAILAKSVYSDIPAAVKEARQNGTLNGEGYIFNTDDVEKTKAVEEILGPIEGVTAVANDPEYNQRLAEKSIMHRSSEVMAYLYTHPQASVVAFARDLGQTLGFIPKTAYAQGIGFSGLAPLLNIWKAFRNVAYAILALFLIIIGFMIMFRKKIDPKTVVTVQNALPRVVLALILITFSYAIVGFMIDLMYLMIMLLGGLFSTVSTNITPDVITKYVSGNFGTVFGDTFVSGLSTIDDILALFGPFSIAAHGVSGVTAVVGILGAALNPATIGVAVATLAAPSIILVLLIALALLIAVIRVLVMLISAYVQIIIALLTAPLQLLMVAMPGSTAFEDWMKNLVANLIVFPITAGILMLSKILASEYSMFSGQRLWGAPMLNPSGTEGLTGVIALGLLFTIPNIAGSIKEALKAKTPVQAGPGAIFSPIWTGATQGLNLMYQGSMVAGPVSKGLDFLKQGKKDGH
jgi:hypothetical protein